MSFDPEVTIYSHYEDTANPHYRRLSAVLERIKGGKLRDRIEHIRSLPTKEERDPLKKQLPAVIFSGKCGKRLDANMLEYSGLVVLDFDKVPADFRPKLEASPFTYACWLSPTGTGLKALVRITDGTRLRDHFRHIEKHLWPKTENTPGVDTSGKNPSRLCFDSYDPNLYINPDAQVYTKLLEDETYQWTERKAPEGSPFDKIIRWLDKRGDAYLEGNRNNYIFKLACACCRFGMDEQEAVQSIGQQWASTASFTGREMAATVRSAYKRSAAGRGTATFDKEQLVNRTGTREIDLEPMPPDGRVADVIYAKDTVEEGLEIKNKGYGRSERWGCDEMGFNPMRGEVNVITGYANAGKSALMSWMQLCYSFANGTKWAVFGPETYPAGHYYHELVEMIEASGLYPSSGYSISDPQYRKWNEWVHNHFFYTYPQDTPNLGIILNRFLQLIIMEGVQGVVIDPWNQMEPDYTETTRDDRILQRDLNVCKRFAVENNVHFFILAHPKNPVVAKGEKNFPCPRYNDLAGGAMWAARTDNILAYHRPEFNSAPSATGCQVHKLKIKKPYVTGRSGMVDLDYDYTRRRFVFGDKDPLGDLLRPPAPPRPNAGIVPNYARLNGYQSEGENIPEEFWKE